MHKYVAVAFSIALVAQPAGAAQLGVGGKNGGVGVSIGAGGVSASVSAGGASVGASAGAGRSGVSAGIGASGGGLSSGVSASTGSGGTSVGTGVGANSGSASGSGGVGAGVSSGTGGATSGAAASSSSGTSAASSPSSPNKTTAAKARVATAGVQGSVTLPRILRPSGKKDSASSALNVKAGTPNSIVRACRDAVALAASPFGTANVRAWSAGAPDRLGRMAISAPIQVRIQYSRQGGPEIREARIRCQVNASGDVVKLT